MASYIINPTYSFYCRECNIKLTQGVKELLNSEELEWDVTLEDLISEGFFYKVTKRYHEAEIGDYLINTKSIRNMKIHPDLSRSNGCCGPSGTYGLNLVCKNGHEIATEVSDCIYPSYIILSAKYVSIDKWYK